MADTSRLALPLIDGEQALKHITHNEALALLDGAVQLSVEALDHTVPPVSPLAGATYALGVAATGVWAGHDGECAIWSGSGWRFLAPGEGWWAWNKADGAAYVFVSGVWTAFSQLLPVFQNLSLLGVNTTADATNKLAVRTNVALLTALETANGGTGDLRIVLNREAGTNTASLAFQSGFLGRAEIGLAGTNDFVFKVSADGSVFNTGLTLSATGGFVTFNRLFGAEPDFPVVAAGVLIVNTSLVVPAPEAGVADSVDTISGGFDGAFLAITGTAGITLTFNDGTGNLRLGANRVLDNFEDSLLLVRRGTDWIELAYANNG